MNKLTPTVSGKSKARSAHLEDEFKMKKPGHNYSHPFSRSAVCDQYLRQTLRGIKPEVIDYDLAVAYFLDQTDHLHIGSIPQSVDIILKDFEALRPLTGRQDDLHQCALHIKTTLDHHRTHPALEPPFALRYPTLKSLKLLHNARSELPPPSTLTARSSLLT